MPGHFARPGPVLVDLVRAGPVPVHFAPAGPLLGVFARVGSLPAHFARAGPVAAFAGAGPVAGHFAQPALGHLERVLRARPVLGRFVRPTKLGIA